MPTDSPLPSGFSLRAAAPGDEGAVAAIGIAQDLEDLGEADYSEDEVRSEWSAPGFVPTRDAWMVEADDGSPAAFASLHGEAGRVFMDPRFKGNGIGPHLAALLEDHGRERGAERVMQQVFGANDQARALLAALGYENDQHYWRMRIEVGDGAIPAQPEWPEGLTPLRYQRPRDEIDAHRLIERAFMVGPGNVPQTLAEWRASWGRPARTDPDLTTVVVARGGELVGIATCAVQEEGHAYLAQLAVDEAARGQGLGRALLLETFGLARAKEVPAVALDVNAANGSAKGLYESAGMRVEWHTDRWVKQLG
jgi:ribosomal protein S18 acetylase RimI-like enzyme